MHSAAHVFRHETLVDQAESPQRFSAMPAARNSVPEGVANQKYKGWDLLGGAGPSTAETACWQSVLEDCRNRNKEAFGLWTGWQRIKLFVTGLLQE